MFSATAVKLPQTAGWLSPEERSLIGVVFKVEHARRREYKKEAVRMRFFGLDDHYHILAASK
jgi:hypothetical protein